MLVVEGTRGLRILRNSIGCEKQSSSESQSKEAAMSLYASSSDSYWKERQQTTNRSPLQIASIVLLALVAVVASILYIQSTRNSSNLNLSQRRTFHHTTELHWEECESRVNSRQECTVICQPERNSIQRKTMHQACLHGCQQSLVASAVLGCRGKVEEGRGKERNELIEEDVFQDVGVLAYNHCSKFQGMDPKPDVFATCRKYHRAGTKQGFRLGIDAMKSVLDEEWEGLKGMKSEP